MVFKRELTIYYYFIKQAQMILFQSRTDFLLLYSGKLLVLVFSIVWVDSVFKGNFVINGYTKESILIYLGVFLVLDRLIQVFFYRSLFFVQYYVRSGAFDKILTLPIKPLIYATFKMTDLNDLIMAIPSLIFLLYAINLAKIKIDLIFVISLAICFTISLIIAYSFLIFIASLAFRFVNVENMYLLYRDFANASRFPPEIYGQILSFTLLFVIPIFAIFAIPAKFIFGSINLLSLIGISSFTIILLILSTKFWSFSIKKYTSAGG